MKRQKGGSQAVSHINNSLGRSQIGLEAKDKGGGGGGGRHPPGHLVREVVGVPLLAPHNPYRHKHTSSFLT